MDKCAWQAEQKVKDVRGRCRDDEEHIKEVEEKLEKKVNTGVDGTEQSVKKKSWLNRKSFKLLEQKHAGRYSDVSVQTPLEEGRERGPDYFFQYLFSCCSEEQKHEVGLGEHLCVTRCVRRFCTSLGLNEVKRKGPDRKGASRDEEQVHEETSNTHCAEQGPRQVPRRKRDTAGGTQEGGTVSLTQYASMAPTDFMQQSGVTCGALLCGLGRPRVHHG